MYKIVEIFKGIQGEGAHTGTPATFVRFYGCNLQCNFGKYKCDEPLHTQGSAMERTSLGAILEATRELQHVVITGGEPSLYDLNELIKELQAVGHYVQVETNGYKYENIKAANFITYSPKIEFDVFAPKMQAWFHELKLLADSNHTPDTLAWSTVGNKYIQPISNGDELDIDNIKWCADWVLKHPDWKLSIQTHKIYGGR